MTETVAPVIDSVSVWDLHEPRSLAQAWREWSGFVQLLPPEHSRLPPPFVPTKNMPHLEWFQHTWTESRDVHALGVHFLRDVTFTNQGIPFVNGRLVRQDAYLHHVAEHDLSNDPSYIPGSIDRLERVFIDRPVLDLIGPGSAVYGHWLMDFLPRAAVARTLLGSSFDEFIIALPTDVPDWTIAMLRRFVAFNEKNIVRYDRYHQYLYCPLVGSPTFTHSSGGYFFHSYMRDFYNSFIPIGIQHRKNKICLSRRNFEQETRGVLKGFTERAYMEAQAEARGFTLVRPEELDFDEQIATFAQAGLIVGEYGSALHNSVFSPPRTIVGSVRYPNSVQTRLAGLLGQSVVYLIQDREHIDERGAEIYSVDHDKIDSFLDQLDDLYGQTFVHQ